MSTSKKSLSGNAILPLVIPALVGASVSAAAFAAFLALGPDRIGGPPKQIQSKIVSLGNSAVLNDAQRAAVEQTVQDYLIKNPQILVRMTDLLDKQQAEDRTTRVKTAIKDNADTIYRDKTGLVMGNPKGDVTIVEFSDYNCPFCKRAFSDIEKLLGTDKNVRVVMKEFPIFGERSEGTARVAIAAKQQGKYTELHSKLMKNRGPNTEKLALVMAEKLGLDMDRLKQDMGSDKIKEFILETRDLGTKLGIEGTPFFLVGDRVIAGAPEDLYQVFQKHLADIRENGCESGC